MIITKAPRNSTGQYFFVSNLPDDIIVQLVNQDGGSSWVYIDIFQRGITIPEIGSWIKVPTPVQLTREAWRALVDSLCDSDTVAIIDPFLVVND